jgi:hypothetical protein
MLLAMCPPAHANVFKNGDRSIAFQTPIYRVYAGSSDKQIDYAVNDFYSIYYLYMNMIQALKLNEHLSFMDIEKIFFVIVDSLKKGNLVQLQVDIRQEEPLKVTLRPDMIDPGKPVLWLISNYNPVSRKVVTGEALKEAYGTFFYIIGNKLVKYQLARQPKNDAEISKLTINEQAQYYLLDGEPGNDSRGRDMLREEIRKSGDPGARALLYMTLFEYDLLSGKIESAKGCLDTAGDTLASVNDEKKKQYLARLLQYARDIFNYYLKYKGGA